jgi:photosystem II stability/assembly factor-like uncharacterized protein
MAERIVRLRREVSAGAKRMTLGRMPIPALLAVVAALTGLVPSSPSASLGAPSPQAVLYQEEFDGGRAAGWDLEPGWACVQDSQGNWVLRGQGHSWARYRGDSWGDYSLILNVKLVRSRIHINFRVSGCLRYFVGFSEEGVDLNKTSPCGTHVQLKTIRKTFRRDRWYEVTVTGSGGKIEVSVDGVFRLSYTDPQPLLFGQVALETALEDAEFCIDNIRVTGKAPPTTQLRWVKTGGPIGGLGYDVRMRPDSPDTMYVTDAWSGVNLSADGGRTWVASNEGIMTRAGPSGDAIPVFCLTIDPRNPDTLWCGTQNRRGIFKSTDGGRTWTEKVKGVEETTGISFRGFTIDPGDSRIVYAAAEISSFAWTPDGKQRIGREFDLTKGVVYKTTDGGEQWRAIWRGDNLARYVWIDPQNANTVYVSTGIFDREAASGDGVGILKSSDGGKTWRALAAKNGLANLYVGSLFMHPQEPTTLLAGTGNGALRTQAGVYRTTDGGETWTQVLRTGNPVSSVEFALGDPRIAYAGTPSAIYRSEDGGLSWSQVTQGDIYGPPGIRAGWPIDFQVDPRNADRIFVNNYGGGNFVSEDGGRTWAVASHGYTGAQLRDIAVVPNDSRRVYVIGRTGPFRSTNGGDTWEGLNYDPATFAEWCAVEIDPSNSERVLISDEHQGVLLLSSDGGDTWRMVFRHPGANASDFRQRHGFKAIAFSPSHPAIVYAGMRRESRNIDEGLADPSFGVYKSADGGLTWHEANDTQIANQNINVLVVDPGNSDVVYAGTVRKGVLKTLNGGASWQPMNHGLQVLDIRALAVDPHDPQVVYAGAESGGICKSVDGGTSWAAASNGMDPQAAIRSIAVDPTNSQTIYTADLRAGVYCSSDGGSTWTKMNEGLRTRAVMALGISSDGKVLYAATEGEGVFRLDLAAPGGG